MRRANPACMSARVIGFSFVALAGACDLAGANSAAFYLLLVAVSGIAVAALGASGDWLEARSGATGSRLPGIVAGLWCTALTLAVLGSSVRSAALEDHGVPALGAATLAGSLAVFAVLGAVSWRNRAAARPSSARSLG